MDDKMKKTLFEKIIAPILVAVFLFFLLDVWIKPLFTGNNGVKNKNNGADTTQVIINHKNADSEKLQEEGTLNHHKSKSAEVTENGIWGTVVDADEGTALNEVEISCKYCEPVLKTNETGAFAIKLKEGQNPKELNVLFSKSGYFPVSRTFYGFPITNIKISLNRKSN